MHGNIEKCKMQVSLKLSSTASFFLEILFYLVKVFNGNFLIKQRKKLHFGGILAVS